MAAGAVGRAEEDKPKLNIAGVKAIVAGETVAPVMLPAVAKAVPKVHSPVETIPPFLSPFWFATSPLSSLSPEPSLEFTPSIIFSSFLYSDGNLIA